MSTFSILSWCFFLVAAVTAIILTSLSSPLIRRYRGTLLSLFVSSILLGSLAWVTPMIMRRVNPDQSRLTPLDQLTMTQWVEPVSNPESELPAELPADEISWLKKISYRFRFKLGFTFDFQKIITIQDSTIVVLDKVGTLRGFNAYTGINHWSIDLKATHYMDQVQMEKRLFLLDRPQSDTIRITCLDLQNPSVLWQRTIPNSKEGDLSFNVDSQSVIATMGASGVWSLKAKTGEILWKRPEIYSKTPAVPSLKHILIFEPVVANRAGSWYFLDPQTGRTLRKSAHVFPEIQSFIAPSPEFIPEQNFMARVNATQFFYMNHMDLTQLWSYSSPEPVQLITPVDRERYFMLSSSHLLEQRKLKSNDLIWQKKFSEVRPDWIKLTPDHQYFVMPSQQEHEISGVSFFDLENGNYIFTARTSEPILDMSFYGDWFYLASENHFWAFQKQQVNTPTTGDSQ